MAGNLSVSADIATSGMRVQAERLKVIAQNMANADSISTTPGGEPLSPSGGQLSKLCGQGNRGRNGSG